MKRIGPVYILVTILNGVTVWRAIDNLSSLGIGVTPDRDCRDFSSQREAHDFYEANKPSDRQRLDDDNDGIACERLHR